MTVFLVHNTFTPSIAIIVCMIKVKTICIVPHTDMLLQESKSTENQAARLFDSWTGSFLQTIHYKTSDSVSLSLNSIPSS